MKYTMNNVIVNCTVNFYMDYNITVSKYLGIIFHSIIAEDV